ncbi:hypothetical protein [Xanthocytophaga agilis]|uniref:Uncharacterized protein n=1 Tax=Xanthocytophaga agilis TaxID=3048010 RepID=A0AAE3R5C9_9BACT|nr:hypothetical protein [Xanthocytophaga agilis]MDJ1501897.1 hypothetical protein [Xanthocytophaga agilis]
MDENTCDVFKHTVDWVVENAITTATFHVLTPYSGTQLYAHMEKADRIINKNWDMYDTRHVVTKLLT